VDKRIGRCGVSTGENSSRCRGSAKLAKATTDADAKPAKETADAEAACPVWSEQKSADTVIVSYDRRKTVIL